MKEPQTETPEPVEPKEEPVYNEVGVGFMRFSADGHSWNGKPMINLWEHI